MGRTKGLLPLSGNFEPQVAGPFDARSRVETKADLLLLATWQAKDGNPYTYVGMVVTVYADTTEKNNGIYRLKAADYTQEGNWEKAGAGATVDLDAIDTQLNTATEAETATDTTVLYVIGKAKITALKLYNYIAEKLSTVFLKVSEYTGTGTKSVNRATSSQYAGQANADILGRTIHETYALKDSGITPPVNETVDLNNDTPTYTVTDATAPLLSVTNAADTGGEVILLTNLTADKSISIQIFRNDTIINGVTYSDGDTVFASFEYDTTSWYITDTEIPEVPDYSDMTVDAMLENPTIIPKPGYIRVTGHVWIIGTKVFLRTTDTPTPIGIYQCVGAGAGYSNLVLIAAGTALHTVRVKDGDVWYSQYDGKNAGTLVFESFDNKVDNIAGKSLLDNTEITKLAKINVNTIGPEYTVTSEEKTNIGYSRNKVDELESLYSNYSFIQRNFKSFVGTTMILEKEYSHYLMSLSQNSTLSFNTSLLDANVIWSFDVYFDITNFISVVFPGNVYFYGGNQMVDIGIYHYKFESTDNGLTWTANLVSKKIQFISGTGKIIFVKTAANGGNNANDGLTWTTAKATLAGANNVAESGDVVFMQSGKYYVDTYRTVGVENSRSFVLKNGVSVYGGFSGIEYSPDERVMTETQESLSLPYGIYTYIRSIPTNQTIFSGELFGDLAINGSVSYGCRLIGASTTTLATCVVYSNNANTSQINGVKVIGGNGVITGCGVFDNTGFLKIIGCEICDCFGGSGSTATGAIYKATVVNSYIHNITGMPVSANSVFDTTISAIGSNGTDSNGLTGFTQLGTFNHCKITGSKVNFIVGYNSNSIFNSIIESCTITRAINTDTNLFTLINFVMKNCIMPRFNTISNSAFKMVSAILVNNNFSDVGVSIANNGTYIANVLIAHNYAPNGVIICSTTNTPIVTNITVVKNIGVTHSGIVNVPVINSVAWGNRIDGLSDNYYNAGTSYNPSYSAFENQVVSGNSNISISANNTGDLSSPYFKDVVSAVGNTELQFDYDIDNSSYLIDKGNNNYPTNGDGSLYDCKGEIRKIDIVDIGAYENQKL